MARTHSLRYRALYWSRVLVHRAGFDVVREPFRHRFLHMLREHGVDTVLDIGANTGQFATELRRARFAGRIHSVEPLQSAFDQLASRAGPDPRWTVERAAVGERAGTLVMNVSANSVSSSVLPILERSTSAAPQTGYVGREEVCGTTVDAIVERAGLEPARTLLKIDVQGYEKSVLAGAEKTLTGFAAVRTEMSLVPLYAEQALLPEIVGLLADRGFDLWHVEPGFSEPGTRRLLQLDGVFFRTGT